MLKYFGLKFIIQSFSHGFSYDAKSTLTKVGPKGDTIATTGAPFKKFYHTKNVTFIIENKQNTQN